MAVEGRAVVSAGTPYLLATGEDAFYAGRPRNFPGCRLNHGFDPTAAWRARVTGLGAFLVSVGTISIAEIGDRTQLLSLVLAARYRQPAPIIAGITCATLANHAAAGWVGMLFGRFLHPSALHLVVGLSMIGMALWSLKPDALEGEAVSAGAAGAFVATLASFFLAEIGDKTQLATVALAAAYPSLAAVVAGSTLGMLIANVPVVILGNAFAARLPLKAIHRAAALVFLVLGAIFLVRALRDQGV